MIKSPEIVCDRSSTQHLCCYRNLTAQLQVARVSQNDTAQCERVIFPGERWLFEASADAELQIQAKAPTGGIFSQRSTCDRYQVRTGI